jgi:hypothetical protein
MAHRNRTGLVLVFASSIALAGVASGCGGGEVASVPMPSELQPFQTVMPLPTITARPTTEADATRAVRATREVAPAPGTAEPTPDTETRLPDDPDAAVVQLARVGDSPWEPEILGDMAPYFSLQGRGYGVFTYPGGASESGWYQTVVSPTQVVDLVKLLVDEIDVYGLAERHGVDRPTFETGPDGEPAGTGPVLVLYVKTSDREDRLVIPWETIANPPSGDPDAARLGRLREVVEMVDIWRSGVVRDLTPYAGFGAATMGFWSDTRLPYTPETAVAFGTRARSRVPADALVAEWPAEQPLADLVPAAYGADPDEFRIAGADLVAALRAASQRDTDALADATRGFWGPLWRDAGAPARFLVGLRAAVPGGNHVVIDYDHEVPRRGIGLQAARASAAGEGTE